MAKVKAINPEIEKAFAAWNSNSAFVRTTWIRKPGKPEAGSYYDERRPILTFWERPANPYGRAKVASWGRVVRAWYGSDFEKFAEAARAWETGR